MRRSKKRRRDRSRTVRRKHRRKSIQSNPTGCVSCGDCFPQSANEAPRRAGFVPKRRGAGLHQPREFLELWLLRAVLAHDRKENLLERRLASFFAGDACALFFKRALRDEPAFVDDGHVAAQTLNNFENMRSQKDSDAALRHASKKRFERACSKSIHAFKRLVEKKNARTVNHSRGQREFFLHAVRIVRDQRFWPVRELHEIEQFLGAALRCGTIEAIHAADELKIFGARQSFEKAHTFGNDADLPFNFNMMRSEV